MSTADDTRGSTVMSALSGAQTHENAKKAFDAIVEGWDLPRTYIGDGQTGIPLSQFKQAVWESHRSTSPTDDEETLTERRYGTRHPFIGAMLVGREYDPGNGEARDANALFEHTRDATPEDQRALVDDGIVKDASPIEVDPMIIDIQRSNAPILDVIQAVAQPGFQAQYNVFDGRTLNDFFLTESEAADLTDNTGSEFSLQTETKDMRIIATLINVSDFSARAEQTLDYMDLMDTTVGQVMKEIFITKAKTYVYGENGAAGSGLHEDSNGFDGLAKFAADADNVNDKTGINSGFLEDVLDYLTDQTTTSGLTFGRSRVLCSPQMYNAIYDEVTPVIRLDGYDADVEYGPQGIAIGHERGSVPITPVPAIRDVQSSSSGVGSNSTNGDVFIFDEQAVQYRQLAPMSSVSLGRDGLSEKVGIFEYGTLIDKSLETSGPGGHTHRLRYGSV